MNRFFIYFILMISTPVMASKSIIQSGEQMSMQVMSVSKKDGRHLVINLLNKSGKAVQSLVTPPTSKENLRKFLPSSVSRMMKSSSSKAKSSGALVAKVMSQKFYRFPVESAAFFAALGAVMTYELTFNYNNNPLAYQQLIDSQMDPVGQLAFYFFMVGNGVAAEPLMNMIHEGKLNRRLAPFIPYFGMSVGSVASNIVHELGYAPNMWACAKGLATGKGLNAEACDKAAMTWNERGGAAGVANEWAPGLASLIGSTIASGIVQQSFNGSKAWVINQSIKKGIIEVTFHSTVRGSIPQIIRVAGLEVATFIAPGGMIVKGYRTLAFITQLAVFSWLDEIMRRPIAFAYANVTQGKNLLSQHQAISAYRQNMKKQQWAKTITVGDINMLKKYSKGMSAWRQANLATVLEVQANWENALADLSNMYRSSHTFYLEFLSHIWQKQYGRYADFYKSGEGKRIIDETFPLNGVKFEDLGSPFNEIIFSMPDMVEDAQKITISNLLSQIENGNFQIKNKLPALTGDDKKTISSITSLLKSTDVEKIGQGLLKVNSLISQATRTDRGVTYLADKSPAVLWATAIRKFLGPLDPIVVPGLGYARYFQTSEAFSEQIQKTRYPKDQTSWKASARFPTPTLAESMIASMIFGPNLRKNENVVEMKKGFASVFKPPQVVTDDRLGFLLNETTKSVNVFTTDIGYPSQGKKVANNAFQYLSSGNIDNQILNSNADSIQKWWDKNVLPKYEKAWLDYEKKYQSNIARLVQRLWAPRSAWNPDGIPNGILASYEYENAQYLAILKEMAVSKIQYIPSVPNSLVKSNKKTTKPATVPFWQRPVYVLKNPWEFKLKTQSGKTNYVMSDSYRPQTQAKLDWHVELTNSISSLRNELKKIKAKTGVSSKNSKALLPVSSVDSKIVESKIKAVGQALAKASQFFGLKQSVSQSGTTSGVVFSSSQKAMAEKVLTLLKQNADEIGNYALVANSVSYRARHNEEGYANPRCLADIKLQKAIGAQHIRKAIGCE